MNTDDLIIEARARITSGDKPGSARAFLTSNGMAADEAEAKNRELAIERIAEIKKLGTRDVLIGVVLIGAASLFLVLVDCSITHSQYDCSECQGLWRLGACGSLRDLEVGERHRSPCSSEVRARIHTRHIGMKQKPKKPDAANLAMTLPLTIESRRRRIADFGHAG